MFHALYDRIYRSDVLWEAWKRVRSNKGAAGVDNTTLRSIEEQGVTRFLEGIQADLKTGRYRPSPVKSVRHMRQLRTKCGFLPILASVTPLSVHRAFSSKYPVGATTSLPIFADERSRLQRQTLRVPRTALSEVRR
jgi:hypothetical protein